MCPQRTSISFTENVRIDFKMKNDRIFTVINDSVYEIRLILTVFLI